MGLLLPHGRAPRRRLQVRALDQGHVAALVNPTSNPKARYQTATDNPADPAAWLQNAETHTGSWWTDYADWLGERSGESRPAPAELGRGRFEPIAAAPGTYQHDH